jgi:diadenosine tetraphosphatase ApaH/serine/threonine PP2A family protein phosphatase
LRVGIVTDIHSNLPALEAVLTDMGSVDALWCLGDFVGYGPWPNECIDLLRERGVVSIVGNHDLAVLGRISTEEFNQDAAAATEWTAGQLTAENRDFLASLKPMRDVDEVTLAHGSPREPVWEYLVSGPGAAASFPLFSTRLCFVGHTHIPSLFIQREDGKVMAGYMESGTQFALGAVRGIANPGSVGQPRDRDPRSAYLIYDTEGSTLEWRRVPYDIGFVQTYMRDVRLPAFLRERLSYGV